MSKVTLLEIDQYLRSIFPIEELKKIDSAYNGLQLGRLDKTVTRVAFAVDACLETFERAISWKADLLLVHHGIFWGSMFPITGNAYDRVSLLCKEDLALYAIHLPLDMHPQLGNNAGLANQLGLTDRQEFGTYKGVKIGVVGNLPEPQRIEVIGDRLFTDDRSELGRLPFGKEKNVSVAIVSGGACDLVDEAIALGVDLFITGDADHTIYHRCLEAGINVIFGGHYQTEIWGVSLLAKRMSQDLGLSTCFIDLPTGF